MENKKDSKGILVIIIVALILLVICLIGYIILGQVKSNNAEEPINKVENSITLTDNELKNYLSYVPLSDLYENDAYSGKNVSIDNIDKKLLLEMAFSKSEKSSFGDTDDDAPDEIVEFEELENNLKKMYNLTSNTENEFNVNGGYVKKGNKYYEVYYGEGSITEETIGNIVNYKATDNELVIYEKTGIAFLDVGSSEFYLKTDDESPYKTYECSDDLSYDECDEEGKKEFSKIFNDNSNKFLTFKHTFKKNDTGYYWYQTEVESEN